MPEFEELEGRSSTGDSQTEGSGKSAAKTSRITVPVAPHRGQTIEYSPRRRGAQSSRDRSRGGEGDKKSGTRTLRASKIDSAYTRRTLPESLANLPAPPKGPGLLARFKAFLISLYKSLKTGAKGRPKEGGRQPRRPRSHRRRRGRQPANANKSQPQASQAPGSRRKPRRRRRPTARQRSQSGTKAFAGGTDSDAPEALVKPSPGGGRRRRRRRRRKRSDPSN